MAKTYVLDRVAADLVRGNTHPAIQRLSSLVAAYPNDLDLRRRLAAVHRRVGNRIQAGRWDYLTIGADARDTQAFERAFPSAIARLRQVRWPYRAGEAATAYARSRLAKLVAAAAAERRPALPDGADPAELPAPVVVGGHGGRSRRPARPAAATRPGRPAGAARVAGPAGRVTGPAGLVAAIRYRLRPGRPRTAFALATAVTVALAAVGVATVVEWIVR